eukprot:gb/GECG01010799.1/.p1 GENE.gb/GECG01010799.1/~~gb/GECG01010799.1/.p1  ORF type:complete len:189 (+),score=26.25 gb/GECG01010799.1/:1-567(+)
MSTDDKLTLSIQGHDGNTISVRVKLTTPFSKIFHAYASRHGLDPEVVSNKYRFTLPGSTTVIQADDTPKVHELKDGGQVNVKAPQDTPTATGNTQGMMGHNNPTGGDKVKLIFNQGGQHTPLTAKVDKPFVAIFSQFEKHRNLTKGHLKYVFDGAQLNEDDSPESIGMEDGDVIDVQQSQVGGMLYQA